MPSHGSRQMPLSEVLGRTLAENICVSGLQLDSRLIVPGDLFLAVVGELSDGRDYIGDAVKAGAVAVLAEQGVTDTQRASANGIPLFEESGLDKMLSRYAANFYSDPSVQFFLAGITGTNGKTTTSRLAAQLLRSGNNSPCGVIGTLGSVLDDSVDEALNTTPDAVSLQRQLALWNEQEVAHAALEVSSHALVQGRVSALHFDAAVFTNLSHDHLDYHGDMQRYAEAKTILFQSPELETAIVNVDDEWAAKVLEKISPATRTVRYSLKDSQAELCATNIRHDADGVRAYVKSPWGCGELHCPLPADFNLSNMLAALAISCSAGVGFDDVLKQAPSLRGVPGRMEYIANALNLQLVVDYSHTPDALLQALAALRPHTAGQLICVFGCGGDRDAEKRPLMGRVAAEYADRVIVTSDNPRGENPAGIIEEILAGCEFDVEVEQDRAAAILHAVVTANPGDCVLVAGKGHETYQQLGAERLPFSDAQQLRLAAIEGCKS